MDMKDQKLLEKFEADFDKISSCEGWTKEQVEMMKDLQKLMYYIEVRNAMKEGSESNWDSRGYGTGHTGRSGWNYSNRYMPSHDTSGYGRRYYDSEKDNAISRLHYMMENESNPELRMALQSAIRELEAK